MQNILIDLRVDRLKQLETREWNCKVKEDDFARALRFWSSTCGFENLSVDPINLSLICAQNATAECKTHGQNLVSLWIDVLNETCLAYSEAQIIAKSCKYQLVIA